MLKRALLFLVLCLLTVALTAQDIVSPNGRMSVAVNGNMLTVNYQRQPVLEISVERVATPIRLEYTQQIKVDYQMLAGKKTHCTNEANEYSGAGCILRVYNDGIAFRTPTTASVAYHITEGTRRWMQQWTEAYEGFFPLTTSYKQVPIPSFSGVFKSEEGYNNRWGYPALLEPQDGVFTLLTEANIERGQSASCLYNEGEEFRIVPDETIAETTKPYTPWRVAIIGSLADIIASTLVTDVSEPCRLNDTSWIRPGVVSWIYWAYNHGSNDYHIIKKYVDLAVTLHLPYVLIDAEWDEMDKVASNEGKTIDDAIGYARSKGIKPLIWYNSSVGWVNGAPGPKYRLNKPEDREREFAWCERLGVAGVKIDFFSGDNQQNMEYCIDLLECAARHHLLVNFHGAPIPRGWQRTYPNLLSTEGVYGAEWYNNVPTFTNQAACHNATLPFTRNVIGPMDYTPCAFSDSQHPHITTHAHELALTVLYESGLQHLADRPESFLAQPAEIQQFLSQLPVVWDDTRYVAGYPGESAVLTRRSGHTWYVAGINGRDEAKTIPLALDFLPKGAITLYADGQPWNITHPTTLPQEIVCQPRGGFVLVVKTEDAQPPQVYTKENTGSHFKVPAMLAPDALPIIHDLPDALAWADGSGRVSRFTDWEKRRNEIAAQIQHYGIGTKPSVSSEQVKARMDGDTLIVDVTVDGETLTLRSTIHYPKTGKPPYALMIGTSMLALPKALFDDRPIATMNFHEAQVNDYSQWRPHHERGEHPFDRLYPALKDNGAYSEWAWGMSRLIDGLQQLGPENTKIDVTRIGVSGCSYAGKMALFCGAFDERIALTIAQEPGGGGAAAWRISHQMDSVECLDKTDYHWFLESQRDHFGGNRVYRLPYDHHELCAMVCPRALLLLGNPDYKWLADESMRVSANAARQVWQQFGIADRFDCDIVGGHPHCQLPESQYAIVGRFLDYLLKQ